MPAVSLCFFILYLFSLSYVSSCYSTSKTGYSFCTSEKPRASRKAPARHQVQKQWKCCSGTLFSIRLRRIWPDLFLLCALHFCLTEKAVEELSLLNPELAPASSETLSGKWRLIWSSQVCALSAQQLIQFLDLDNLGLRVIFLFFIWLGKWCKQATTTYSWHCLKLAGLSNLASPENCNRYYALVTLTCFVRLWTKKLGGWRTWWNFFLGLG